MVLARALERIAQSVSTCAAYACGPKDYGTQLLKVCRGYQNKAFPSMDLYQRMLRNQHSVEFSDYDVLLIYRLLYFAYRLPELFAGRSGPGKLKEKNVADIKYECEVLTLTLALMALAMGRHIVPVVAAVRTFIATPSVHDVYIGRKRIFSAILDSKEVQCVYAMTKRTIKWALKAAQGDKSITCAPYRSTYYCSMSDRHAMCCPIMTTAFIDTSFNRFVDSLAPCVTQLLQQFSTHLEAPANPHIDMALANVVTVAAERGKYRGARSGVLYLPDISCGTSFGTPVSCYGSEQAPGPTRLNWLPTTCPQMSITDEVYPVNRQPKPCACFQANKESSSGHTCTAHITSWIQTAFQSLCPELQKRQTAASSANGTKDPKDTTKATKPPAYTSALDLFAQAEHAAVCSCVKRDILFAAQLNNLTDVDELLCTLAKTPGVYLEKATVDSIASLFSSVYYDVLVIENRETNHYITIPAPYNAKKWHRDMRWTLLRGKWSYTMTSQGNSQTALGIYMQSICSNLSTALRGTLSENLPIHPLYYDTDFLYSLILHDNSVSPHFLSLVEQIRTKRVQILVHRILSDNRESVYECSRNCGCLLSCPRRCVQFGKRYNLQVFRVQSGYWGLRTLDFIPKGAFVCEYSGHLLTEECAERCGFIMDAQRCSYLYDISYSHLYCQMRQDDTKSVYTQTNSHTAARCSSASAGLDRTTDMLMDSSDNSVITHSFDKDTNYSIDSAYAGNEGRYINHRKKANLTPKHIVWDDDVSSDHIVLPHLCFFALRDIMPLEELSLDYKYQDDGSGSIKEKYPWAFEATDEDT